ncbi:MAG: WbqC family protein [Weeksellaceae bacterium]
MEIFSAHFFPTIRYMKDWIQAEYPVLDNYENMQKQSYRTRCYIVGPNGRQMLSVPTQKNNQSRRIKDIKICYAEAWRKEHFKTLEAAYRSSPYFEYYEDIFQDILNQEFDFLFDLNYYILERILKIVQVNDKIEKTNQYYDRCEMDYREAYQARKEPVLIPAYPQVFEEKLGFKTDLSIIDLICNQGPESLFYLKNL